MWSCTSSLRVHTRGLPGDRHKNIYWSGMTVPRNGDDRYRLVHPPQCSDDCQPVLFGQQHVQDKHAHGLLGSIALPHGHRKSRQSRIPHDYVAGGARRVSGHRR